MRRREFIWLAGLMAVLPRVGRAQAQSPTIGVLVLRKTQWRSVEDQFLQGLRDSGYIDGKTIHIELRTAEGNIDLLKPLAEELVGLGVGTIVALFTPAVVAAKSPRSLPLAGWSAFHKSPAASDLNARRTTPRDPGYAPIMTRDVPFGRAYCPKMAFAHNPL